ncbi:Sucrase/ferredoxin-like-domain-containing protein [Nemania sp. FL0916]|nr:Sucrase/ferredoxin-like-domain-containing protein [Nemania sp. FL0916]
MTVGERQQPPLKQKMALGFKSLLRFATGEEPPTAPDLNSLFPATDPAVDGDDCTRDCESCHVSYPRGFKVETHDLLYGHVKGWSTHVVVATGKSDWVRDVEDEKGSVMEAFGEAASPTNGRLMLSASNMPTPSHTSDYSEPTTALVLPAFTVIENITPAAVPHLISSYINHAPTTESPLGPITLPRSLTVPDAHELIARPSPHRALILLCSHRTRDARCGQSAPILRKELERHLRPLGLYRDLDDERPGGVGIYFINHVGGHKYSANMLVYRRPDAFGVDGVERARLQAAGEEFTLQKPLAQKRTNGEKKNREMEAANGNEANGDAANGDGEEKDKKGGKEEDGDGDVGAAQCIWLARVRPEDCENIVRYTVLQGKVVKPASQLRGGFDRGRGLMSW